MISFVERGDSFLRRSAIVPPDVRTLLEPRPRVGGKPLRYRYAPPTRLADDIPVADAADGGCSHDTAERLVNGVIDGTYRDVHSMLIHHRHELRLEEYFYGYDRQRTHRLRSLTKSVVALLAGIGVDKGLLRADEPVFARLGYPAYANPDPRKARVTLIDLLGNQSGLAASLFAVDGKHGQPSDYQRYGSPGTADVHGISGGQKQADPSQDRAVLRDPPPAVDRVEQDVTVVGHDA